MSDDDDTTGHVVRAEVVEKLRRLNELERVIPIYRVALEQVALTNGSPGRIARDALKEADR